MSLSDLYAPIETELQRVEKTIREVIQDKTNPKTARIADTLLASPGKRIRPALTLLCGKAVSQARPVIDPAADQKLIKIASAFEIIHMASLVHDDVIDQSDTRHNKPTINCKWGEDSSIAFGDFLYAISLHLTTECRDLKLHKCMSRAARDMCEGELLQVCEKENFDLSRKKYLTMVQKKTAGLFASSCEAGAIIYYSSFENQEALRQMGQNLGIAFQMIDDYLDLVAEEKSLGKSPGQDIEIGKITLPLLYLLEELPAHELTQTKALLTEADNPVVFQKIKGMLENSEAITKTIRDINYYMNEAALKLDFLPASVYKESLSDLIEFITDRALSFSSSEN